MSDAPRRWGLVLFGLPFAAVGLGFLLLGILPTLSEWRAMQHWQPVPAEVLDAGLETRRGDDSNTYLATAHYRYRWQGRNYESRRVGLSAMADNIGHWQQDTAAELQRAQTRQQPITVFVNPAQPTEAIYRRELRPMMLMFFSAFFMAFTGAGIGLVAYGLHHRRTPGPAILHPDQPWLDRPEWASAECVDHQRGKTGLLWGVALVWCAITLPANAVIADELAKGNWAILVILLFDAVGIGLLVIAVRQTLAARRFGNTRLRLDPWPGAIGGEVGGCIAARLPFDERQIFRVRLSCIHTRVSGSGKHRKTHETVRWQDEHLLHAQYGNDDHSQVWFCFSVPTGLPASEPPSDNHHHWRLDAFADVPGVDFRRRWELPVFATAGLSAQAARQTRPAQAATLENLERLMNLRQVPGGITLDYPAGRAWRGGSLTALVGLVFAGVAIFIAREARLPGGGLADGLISIVTAALAGLLIGVGLWQCGNRLRVRIDQQQVRIRRHWLGLPVWAKTVPRSTVQEIRIQAGTQVNTGGDTRVHYRLLLATQAGDRYTIGDGFVGHSKAQQAAEAVSTLGRLPLRKQP